MRRFLSPIALRWPFSSQTAATVPRTNTAGVPGSHISVDALPAVDRECGEEDCGTRAPPSVWCEVFLRDQARVPPEAYRSRRETVARTERGLRLGGYGSCEPSEGAGRGVASAPTASGLGSRRAAALSGRLDYEERVPVGVAEEEHWRHWIAHAHNLVVDIDAPGFEARVIGVDGAGAERHAGLNAG
jgi:hypothetical protein